jgi:hypothetical protein
MCCEDQLLINFRGLPLELISAEKLPSHSAIVSNIIVKEFLCISFGIFETEFELHLLAIVDIDNDLTFSVHSSLTEAHEKYTKYVTKSRKRKLR